MGLKVSQKTLYHNTYRVETTRVNWHKYNDGVYFVTICTQDVRNANIKPHLFGTIDAEVPIMHYSEIGERCVKELLSIEVRWVGVKLLEWVVMPNHVHLILDCRQAQCRLPKRGSLLSEIVRQFKSGVANQARLLGKTFRWQSRFYEHIIRMDGHELAMIANYIQHNIAAWQKDCFYSHQ